MLEIIVVAVVLMLSFLHYHRKSRGTLPGPSTIPFFGVLFQMNSNQLHLKLYDWTSIYGDIFQFSILGKTFISLNSAELIREFLGTEPTATIASSREPSFFGEYCMENYSDVISSPYNKEWTKRRKLFHRFLHSFGKGIQFLEDNALQKLKNVKRYLAENSGQNVDPRQVVEEFLFENLASLVAGTTDKELQRLMKEVDDSANEIVPPLVDLIFKTFPFLLNFPFSFSKKPSYCKFKIDELMIKIQKMSTEMGLKQGMYYEMKNGRQLTHKEIKCILTDVIVAGVLTSRGTLLSLVHLLAEHPNIQSRLQAEIDDVIGQGDPHLTDRNGCPFTEAFVIETLRFISHAPISIPHYTMEACKIRGHTVDKGTTILTNLWTVHHSDEWGDPFTFRPERFLDDSGQLLPTTHPIRKRLLLFGYGKRSCLGELFAKNRAFLFIVTLLQTCNVTKPSDQSLTALDPHDMIGGGVLQPKPYTVQLKLRNQID